MLRNKVLISLLLFSSLFGAKYLAVLDLEPVGITDMEAKVLTQRLTSKMIELSDYTIVERANIDKILKEQKFQHSGCTDSECAVEIGQLINADVTVIGTVSKFGETYTIDAKGKVHYIHDGYAPSDEKKLKEVLDKLSNAKK